MNSDRLDTRRILACLGDESRFRVILELVRGDRCVTDLAGRVGLSQSCTTRHLQTLEREGLVRGSRSGKRVFFSVSAEPRVAALLAWVLPNDLHPALAEDGDGASGSSPEPDAPPAGNTVEPRHVPDLEDFLL